MRKESYEFLRSILETPSPSGFEQPVQRIVRKRMKPFADAITTDVHGNVAVTLNPKGSPSVMLAGHADQIGLMVKYIDDHGYIFVVPIGGIDPSVLPGSRVIVHSQHGPIDAVIGRKPIHLLRTEERGAKVEMHEMWVDIGAKNKKEVEQVVSIGDPVTFPLALTPLGSDRVTAPAFDNKCGVFVVMEALRLCAEKKMPCALHAVSTVQEEIGLRGARTSCYGLDPQVGIAVDVTHATDYPSIDKRTSGDLKLGNGPTIVTGANVNPKLGRMLTETAKSKRIPYQVEGAPGGTSTDANAIQLSRSGVAAALIGIPNRYMHTQVEVVSLTDLTNASRLIAETVAKISRRTNFIPE